MSQMYILDIMPRLLYNTTYLEKFWYIGHHRGCDSSILWQVLGLGFLPKFVLGSWIINSSVDALLVERFYMISHFHAMEVCLNFATWNVPTQTNHWMIKKKILCRNVDKKYRANWPSPYFTKFYNPTQISGSFATLSRILASWSCCHVHKSDR